MLFSVNLRADTQKDMCSIGIGLAQHILTGLGSIIDMIGGTYMTI
jgi:hypothetical protein